MTCFLGEGGRPWEGEEAFPDGNANSIRLWRVILLCSDIRLSPSGIRYASFWANRISLQGNALKYHFCEAKIAKQKYHAIEDSISLDTFGKFFFYGWFFGVLIDVFLPSG